MSENSKLEVYRRIAQPRINRVVVRDLKKSAHADPESGEVKLEKDSLKSKIKSLRKRALAKGISQQELEEIHAEVKSIRTSLMKSLDRQYKSLNSLEAIVARSHKPGFSRANLVTDDETLESLLQMRDKNKLFIFE